MGPVRNSQGGAWVPLGSDFCLFPGASLNSSAAAHGPDRHLKTARRRGPRATRPPLSGWRARDASQQEALEGPVLDLVYIGLTIVIFAALFLLVKGVERFER